MATKVVVDFTLPGGVMVSREVERQSPKDNTDEHTMTIYRTFRTKDGIKNVPKKVIYHTRKSIDAHKTLKIDNEYYQSMLEEPTDGIRINKWKSLGKKQRLKFHLDGLAADFGATSYTFEILDD